MNLESDRLYHFYKDQIENGSESQRESALEWAEEACRIDKVLSEAHYELLVRSYAHVTGDQEVLRRV